MRGDSNPGFTDLKIAGIAVHSAHNFNIVSLVFALELCPEYIRWHHKPGFKVRYSHYPCPCSSISRRTRVIKKVVSATLIRINIDLRSLTCWLRDIKQHFYSLVLRLLCLPKAQKSAKTFYCVYCVYPVSFQLHLRKRLSRFFVSIHSFIKVVFVWAIQNRCI